MVHSPNNIYELEQREMVAIGDATKDTEKNSQW